MTNYTADSSLMDTVEEIISTMFVMQFRCWWEKNIFVLEKHEGWKDETHKVSSKGLSPKFYLKDK